MVGLDREFFCSSEGMSSSVVLSEPLTLPSVALAEEGFPDEGMTLIYVRQP